MVDKHSRIVNVTIAEDGIVRYNPDVEKERLVAVYDLLEANHFDPVGDITGPYCLRLALKDNRLVFDIRSEEDHALAEVALPLRPFRKLVKDYFTVCDSYYDAIKTASPSRIEAIDVGRRSLHDEGSERLRDGLAGKIDIDFETARRLFTLICVLHIRG